MVRLGLLLLGLLLVRPDARAEPLVADLTSHLIAITTGFTGTDVVLFGAVEEEGDVVVVVSGPEQPAIVRRKERVLGIWLNRDSVEFSSVPSFYAVASNRPLSEITDAETLSRNRIGSTVLPLTTARPVAPEKRSEFVAALIREKEEAGLFPAHPGRIAFLGNQLFRTTLYFPANLPTGSFLVQVYLFRDGKLVTAQTTPLLVTPVGLSAEIVRVAYRQPWLYGLVAILLAVMAGWSASLVFRRV